VNIQHHDSCETLSPFSRAFFSQFNYMQDLTRNFGNRLAATGSFCSHLHFRRQACHCSRQWSASSRPPGVRLDGRPQSQYHCHTGGGSDSTSWWLPGPGGRAGAALWGSLTPARSLVGQWLLLRRTAGARQDDGWQRYSMACSCTQPTLRRRQSNPQND
jgi:hypothetical protein